MQPINILIVCEHASNVFGGEAMLPLNYFRLLSKTHHQVYLITHERTRANIEQLNDIDQSRIYYLPDTWMHKFLSKHFTFLPERVYVMVIGFLIHLITQMYQWKVARSVVKEKNIHVVHEPAPVSATQPSAMFALGVPVVIGPMNGGMTFPVAFNHMSGRLEKLVYQLVRWISSIYNLLIPGKLFAKLLLVANQRTKNSLPRFKLGEVLELVENGVFTTKDQPAASHKTDNINVLFVGRLVDWKAVDIVIDAVSQTQAQVNLMIVGDGAERTYLEQYAQKQRNSRVTFLGMVPHAKVNQYYDAADIFVLPSVRECGGAVVLEAMSRGLPVIATDWGGPADYITPESGYLIKPESRHYMVSEFARIIDLLSASPQLRYQVGLSAINRVKQHFMWDSKLLAVIEHYKTAIKKKI